LGEGPTGGRLSTFGHGGLGGNWGFADPEYGLAVGIAMTAGYASRRAAPMATITQRIRAVFGIPEHPAA
jgi:CubicO group peptidase (beta-lactamase class C family)